MCIQIPVGGAPKGKTSHCLAVLVGKRLEQMEAVLRAETTRLSEWHVALSDDCQEFFSLASTQRVLEWKYYLWYPDPFRISVAR